MDGTLTVMNGTITGSGPSVPGASPSAGIDVDSSSGTFTFDSLSITDPGSSGIRLNNTEGDLMFTSLDISGTGSHGIELAGVSGVTTLNGVSVTGAGGNGIDLVNSGAGTFTFGDVSVSDSGDSGLRVARVDTWDQSTGGMATGTANVTVRDSRFNNNLRGFTANLTGAGDFSETAAPTSRGTVNIDLIGNSFGDSAANLVGTHFVLPVDPTDDVLHVDITITDNRFANLIDLFYADLGRSPAPPVTTQGNTFAPLQNVNHWRGTDSSDRIHAVAATALLRDLAANNEFIAESEALDRVFFFDPDAVPGTWIPDAPLVADSGLAGQELSSDMRNAVQTGDVLVNDRQTFFRFDSEPPGSQAGGGSGGVITGGYLFPVGDPNADDGAGRIDFFRPLILQFPDDLGRSSADARLPLATNGGPLVTTHGPEAGAQLGARPPRVVRRDAGGNALVAFVHRPEGHIVTQRSTQGSPYNQPVLIDEVTWIDAQMAIWLFANDGVALLTLREVLEAGTPSEIPGLPLGGDDLLSGLNFGVAIEGLELFDGEFAISGPASDGRSRVITNPRGTNDVLFSDPFFIDDTFSNDPPFPSDDSPPGAGVGLNLGDVGLDLLNLGTSDPSAGLGAPSFSGSGLRTSQADETLACNSDCVWIVAADSQKGSAATLYLVDPNRIPDEPGLTIDPSAEWADAITGIPNGHLGLGVDMADLNGDGWVDIVLGVPGGHPDDLFGDPKISDERGVAYVLLGLLTSGDLNTKVARVYGGSQPRERFGGDTEIADVDGDGVLDITITSTLHRRVGAVFHSGMAFFFLGRTPTIDSVVPVGGNTAIFGQNLDSTVLLDGTPAVVLAATQAFLLVEGQGESVEVRGLHGTARAGGARIVELEPGLNLVGWTGATPIEDALATVEGAFDSVFTWNAFARLFNSFNPDAPAFINTLSELVLGDALWIQVADPAGAVWTQPDFDEARAVVLSAGLNLAMWTGPDGTPVADALGAIAGATSQVLVWDTSTKTFRSFNRALPAALNTLKTLNFGDAFWIEMDNATVWSQPAR